MRHLCTCLGSHRLATRSRGLSLCCSRPAPGFRSRLLGRLQGRPVGLSLGRPLPSSLLLGRPRRRRRGGLPLHLGPHCGSSCGRTLLIGTRRGSDSRLSLGSQALRLLLPQLLLRLRLGIGHRRCWGRSWCRRRRLSWRWRRRRRGLPCRRWPHCSCCLRLCARSWDHRHSRRRGAGCALSSHAAGEAQDEAEQAGGGAAWQPGRDKRLPPVAPATGLVLPPAAVTSSSHVVACSQPGCAGGGALRGKGWRIMTVRVCVSASAQAVAQGVPRQARMDAPV